MTMQEIYENTTGKKARGYRNIYYADYVKWLEKRIERLEIYAQDFSWKGRW